MGRTIRRRGGGGERAGKPLEGKGKEEKELQIKKEEDALCLSTTAATAVCCIPPPPPSPLLLQRYLLSLCPILPKKYSKKKGLYT